MNKSELNENLDSLSSTEASVHACAMEQNNSQTVLKKEQDTVQEEKNNLAISKYAFGAHDLEEGVEYYKPWIQSYPSDVPEFVNTHQFENLPELFEDSIQKYSSHKAFINMGSSLTYKEVGEYSSAFACYLQSELKMGKGDKLAIMLPNLMQFPVVFIGALKAGVTVININPLYTPRELEAQLCDAEATAIVVIENYASTLSEIIDKTQIKHVIISKIGDCFNLLKGVIVNAVVKHKGLVKPYDFRKYKKITLYKALHVGKKHLANGLWQKVDIHYNDIALLQYTGGTTGRSKGAMLSHGNLIANVAQAVGVYGSVLKRQEETILTVIPLYHIFALTVNLILFFNLGGTNLLITDPRNLKDFANELKKHTEVTALTGVNTLFNLFMTHDEFKDISWKNLRLAVGGGAAVQSGVEQRFFEKTGIHILEGYGLTECSPLCAVCPHDTKTYTGSIGLIVPSCVARIVDLDGNEIRDLIHEGELQIKGPQVMQGYYKYEDGNADIFDDGYVRTGDIAKWMEGGYIKLIDRLKDMIIVSGFNVFPNEIEDVVSRFPRVLECAVIGVPSEQTGEAVKLFVVKRDENLTKEEVKTYCRAYLTPYKVPRIIEFVDALPKSTLGKVLRRRLREMEKNEQANTQLKNQLHDDASMKHSYMSQAKASVIAQDELSDKKHVLDDTILHVSSNQEDEAKSEQNAHEEHSAPSIKKSAGALALERLLSSKIEGLDAAVATPNIHHEHTDVHKLHSNKSNQ